MVIRGSGRFIVGMNVYHDDDGGRARCWTVRDCDWAAHMPKTKPRGPGRLGVSRVDSQQSRRHDRPAAAT
jgi:hypothetical protein